MAWQAVLSDGERRRATDLVGRLGDALLRVPVNEVEALSLAHGTAGLALAHHALAPLLGSDHRERAKDLLDATVAGLARTPMFEGLLFGFTGIAWTWRHLQTEYYAESDGDECQQVDEMIDGALERGAVVANDLLSGIAGVALYLLEAPRNDLRMRALTSCIDNLASRAMRDRTGTRWIATLREVDPKVHEVAPDKCIVLGAAHGQPGIQYALARMVAAGIASEPASALLSDSVHWYMKQCDTGDRDSSYPMGLINNQRVPGTKGWCYGEIGIAVSLLGVARLSDNPELEQFALDLAARAIDREPEMSDSLGAFCLCHGQVGIAHLFARLANATGRQDFRDASRSRWQLVDAGIEEWLTRFEREPSPRECGILTGAAGVALGLQSLASPVQPTWDYVLMMDCGERLL